MSSRKIWHINPTLFGIVKKDQNIGARYGLGASFVGLLLHEQVIYPLWVFVFPVLNHNRNISFTKFSSTPYLPPTPSPTHNFQLCQVPRGRTSYYFKNYFKYI